MAHRFTLFGWWDKLNGENKSTDSPKHLNLQQKSHQLEIETSILVLAAAVVRASGEMTHETETCVLRFLNRQFGTQGKTRRVQTLNKHFETGTEPFTRISCKELKMLTTYDSRLSIIRFLFAVAGADDFVNEKEKRTIHRIAQYLSVSESDYQEVRSAFLSQHSPYFLLGVEEGASYDEVKAAYRKMILKHHPDKRTAHLSEEEAAQKFREIQRAFERITGTAK